MAVSLLVVGRRFVLLSLLVVAAACGGRGEDAFGEELYESACAPCHRTDGAGGGAFPALDAGSDAATLSDEQIVGIVRAGPGAMPAFRGSLTDEQIDSVVTHLRGLQRSG